MLNAAYDRLISISLRYPVKSFSLLHKLGCSNYVAHTHFHSPQPSYQICITSNELLDFFDVIVHRCLTVQQSQQVHTQLLVTGAHQSAFLAAKLITVYASFGFVRDARKVFDAVQVEGLENLLLWNSILRANVSHGYYDYALKLYAKMRKLGFWPDGFTFPLIIRACSNVLTPTLCKIVHCHALQMGFQNNLHVVNELLNMYGKLGQMVDSSQLFDRMVVKSQVSWNMMVSGYASNHDPRGACKTFKQMELEGFQPNSVTWTSLLSSHARCGLYDETLRLFKALNMRGTEISAEALAVVLSVCADMASIDRSKELHSYIVKGGYENYLFVKNALIGAYGKHELLDAHKLFSEITSKNIVSWNALISSYAECGLCDEALSVFLQLEKSDGHPPVRPNVISWGAVIGGFASKGRIEESLELFRRMQQAKVMANCVTISSILSACAELAALNLGREIHGYAVRVLMDDNILVVNGLINMYMKCGGFEEGHLVFDNMKGRDLVSWNSLIGGFGMHGLGENALRTFDEMIKSGIKPDNVTFVVVLSACSHAGLVEEGRKLFDRMVKEFKVETLIEHYACMVDLLGRAGLLREASDIVRSMPIEPNECIWGALLNACRMHRDIDIAEDAESYILSLNSEVTGSYMLLSNIYAASGRWEDSARVRISVKSRGLKKFPGQSLIEVKKKVYTFSAGNVVQSGLEEVYRMLEELALQMESEICASNHVLNQQCIDDEESNLLVVAN
ncbi:putative pentatricopeptide repeat-containing protein At1g17630 [Neltuma alba]|uniref:putative pentatricopeptide repeat-containing protein At1g17630 n=1 Tax=Neltuma alba TaxID=207710 RepID=UPI0010A2CD91|nr:putative pentatricopeptide repeat-containing protein At1g17630 [Prosopis alba]